MSDRGEDDIRNANPSPWVDLDTIEMEMSDLEANRDRYLAEWPRPTPGQLLYERWCGSRRSDRARYWKAMNPAECRAWENLAEDLMEQAGGEAFERVVRNIPERLR